MELSRLWAAMLTRHEPNSGTDSTITLIVNTGGIERLNQTLSSSVQLNQERGRANLYEIDVQGRNIVPGDLNGSSIRVGILGSDAWRAEHFVVWGERLRPFSVFPREIVPLALETDIATQISTDSSEGPAGFPLRLVNAGAPNMPIRRLFMFLTTAGFRGGGFLGAADSPEGSSNSLEIQIVSEGRLVTLFEFSNLVQGGLRSGQAKFYSAPVFSPFTKASLDEGSITLRAKGFDEWAPANLFLFGLDDAAGRPESLIPLVDLAEWPFGSVNADRTNGTASIALPITRDPFLVPGNEVVATLNSIARGQQEMIGLLRQLVDAQKASG